MGTRACTECGASASDDAKRCEVCGGKLENRVHKASDLRIEPERIDALPSDPQVPNGRWSRVSDHPGPEHPNSNDVSVIAEAVSVDPAANATQSQSSRPPASDIAVVGTTEAPAQRFSVPPTTTGSHATLPRRPPVLASEALLRDLAPSRPARRALRIWCPLLGAIGTLNAWFLTHGQGLGWPLAGAFFGLALLGLPPMPYPGRASAVTTVSATGLALVLWTDASRPGGMANVTLTLAVTLLATGLLYRAWHRASLLARLLVGIGVLTCAAFLWMSGDVAHLTLFDTSWQSWLPRLVGLSFGIVLMLSLLAFMDARSTGGSAVWSVGVLCWLELHSAVQILLLGWPKHEEVFDLSRIPTETLLVWTSTPLLAALLTLGLAQLMAAGFADAISKRTTPTLVPQPSPLQDLTPAARPHN
jgi:hypothetical protein